MYAYFGKQFMAWIRLLVAGSLHSLIIFSLWDFVVSKVDPSFFIYNRSGVLIYIFLYVDDILITSNKAAAEHIILQFNQTFVWSN